MYVSRTLLLRSHVTKSLTPNDTTTFAKRYSHVKTIFRTRRFSKTITEYYEDDTQRSTASSKPSYLKRYDHVYSTSLTIRNSQATRVILVCIVTYAPPNTGFKWQPMSIRPYDSDASVKGLGSSVSVRRHSGSLRHSRWGVVQLTYS